MKACTQLQQGCDLTFGVYGPTARLQGANQQLHQGRLARAIVTNDAKALAFHDIKRNILQNMKYAVTRLAQQQLQQAILRPCVDAKILVQIVDRNTVHYKTSPKACFILMNSQPPSR